MWCGNVSLVCFASFMLFSRIQSLVQYMKDPLLSGLNDNSSYVRRNAVIGCAKLFRLAPDIFEGTILLF